MKGLFPPQGNPERGVWASRAAAGESRTVGRKSPRVQGGLPGGGSQDVPGPGRFGIPRPVPVGPCKRQCFLEGAAVAPCRL
eukprot:9504098-Pyramimonas_sp.AAC.1